MSLMSRSRLIMDSVRSPRVAASTATAPVSSPCQTWPCSISVRQSHPAMRQAAAEPAKPSHVFFGLMTGAIRWRPPRPSVIPAK
jgi:hypothetical protein